MDNDEFLESGNKDCKFPTNKYIKHKLLGEENQAGR